MSSPTTVSNLAIVQGGVVTFVDTIYQPDGATPQNISGWSMSFVLHAPGDVGTVYLTKSTVAGTMTIPVGTDGKVDIPFLNADTVNMRPGQYAYSIHRTDAEAVPTSGLFTILAP